MTVDKLIKWCEDCPHATCETCDITWKDIEEIKKDIKENYIPKDKIIKSIDKDIAEWKKLMLSDENDRTKNIWSIECNARRSAYEELLKEE